MTTELVLLLAIYTMIIMGVFLGDLGPLATFRRSSPRLAAKIERDIATGTKFTRPGDVKEPFWEKPGGP